MGTKLKWYNKIQSQSNEILNIAINHDIFYYLYQLSCAYVSLFLHCTLTSFTSTYECLAVTVNSWQCMINNIAFSQLEGTDRESISRRFPSTHTALKYYEYILRPLPLQLPGEILRNTFRALDIMAHYLRRSVDIWMYKLIFIFLLLIDITIFTVPSTLIEAIDLIAPFLPIIILDTHFL